MRPANFDGLGEEPIYCEAQHDHAYYSGSEDEYYEAPEHRRLRIEARAVQFLTGDVPYILSAALQGPFDDKSWDNPWKSKRAQRDARRRRPRSRRSLTDAAAPRGHGSGKVADDLPDTQRTSLCPLPSPETTNPPSARKNAFMEESEYSRIKTWREAVTSVPVTKDPFWASHNSEDAGFTRKRSADEDWLHTRGSKKRRSADRRHSLLTESPSQAAARTRKSHGRFSENMTQSAPVSFSREDMLAARCDAQSPGFDSSRLANVHSGLPDLSQTARHSQSPKRRFPYRETEFSEDELSMPSTIGAMEASRSSGQESKSPASLRRSLTRQKRAATGNLPSRTRGGKVYDEKMVGQPEGSCLSAIQRSRMGMAKSHTKGTARRALEVSQQDDSFHFHARPRNPAEQPEAYQSSNTPIGGTTSLLPAHICALASAEDMTGTGEDIGPEDGYDLDKAHAENRLDSVHNDGQDTPYKPVVSHEFADKAEAGVPNGRESVHEATLTPQAKETNTEDIIQGNQECDAAERLQHQDNKTCAKPSTDRPSFVCTQELSPVSMHESARPKGSVAISEDAAPQHTASIDDDGISTSEWPAQIITQEMSKVSENVLSSHAGEAEGMEIVWHGSDDSADPDWMTYVNTQDPIAESAEEGKAVRQVVGVEIVEQGPYNSSDPGWSTILDIQDQVAAREEKSGNSEGERGNAMNIDVDEQRHRKVVVQDDVGSNSDWSTYMSASSQMTAGQTGNTSHEPAQAEDAASEPKSSQVSLGAIIDAYARGAQDSSGEINDSREINIATEDVHDSLVVPTCQEDDERPKPETQPRQEGQKSMENQHDTEVSVVQLNSNKQTVPQGDLVEENPSTDNDQTNIDETGTSTMPTQSRIMENQETVHDLQSPTKPSQAGKEVLVGTDAVHDTPVSVKPRHIQSPWLEGENTNLRAAAARLNDFAILNETNDNVETTPLQSPWAKESVGPPLLAALDNETNIDESSSDLSMLAGEAPSLPEAPQTPWVGDKLPSPNFSMSVKRFSDFMKPSPTKKRALGNSSILRTSGMSSRVLFGTHLSPKPDRRVTFAPLPGEKDAGIADVESEEQNGAYVEEDVSYFDTKGKKTSSIRVVRPSTRATSPPPQMNAADAGEIPDHDHKFAKHFEVMSKRKKDPQRRAPRLLSSNSQQQASASQEVCAMAEAFIEASQMRKRTAELTEANVKENCQSDDTPAGKNLDPVAIGLVEEQENVEPVDDVSAVLDNLSDFLDNTWGIDMSMNMQAEVDTSAQLQVKPASSRFDNVGDPQLSLHVNIWRD